MSALGQERPFRPGQPNVRFAPKSGHWSVSIHDALLKNGGSRTVFVPPGRAQRDDRPNHAYRRANAPEGMRA